ncbi:MAG: 8-amino-7-oxononanoate synthase [Gammaproteobacteria bacterium]|nr:8-amino-7-oxononanoate synthase [Gammaproteobacteria bacterium]
MTNPLYDDPFDLHTRLCDVRQRDAWRRRARRDGPVSPHVCVEGKPLVSFISNDYLGLAGDARLVEAWIQGAHTYGIGAGASHLLGGHTPAHEALEESLADWVGAQRALLFSTGYMANLAVVTALSGRGFTVYENRRNHASLIDAVTLAHARRVRYRDSGDLERRLAARLPGRGLIVTDGVFSMDGDVAPVALLARLAHAQNLGLIVDDAHALGVIGPAGAGTLAAAHLSPCAGIALVGTLGKALGVLGAFVAGTADLIETLIQTARPYVYTTAVPPALALATAAAVRIAREEEFRRTRLRQHIAFFRSEAARLGLRLVPSDTAIQPLLIGGNRATMAAAEQLRQAGLLVGAVRPPTVPAGQGRLRITLSAAHETADIERLLEGLAALPAGGS